MIKNRMDAFIKEIDALSDFKAKQDCFKNFLKNVDDGEECLIYMSNRKVFIGSVLVKNKNGNLPDDWLSTASASPCLYKKKYMIDNKKENYEFLFYYRSFQDDITKPWNIFLELSQEIEHTLNLFYLEKRSAYCLVDEIGNLIEVVKIIKNDEYSALIFKRDFLEYYLWLSKKSIVRRFYFMDAIPSFDQWPQEKRENAFDKNLGCNISSCLFEDGTYIEGRQNFSYDKTKIVNYKRYFNTSSFEKEKYVTVTVYDPFKKKNMEASTDERKTCSYFDMKNNSFPLQLSCVFFREEVLQKYYSNNSLYSINNGHIRSLSWDLRSFENRNGIVQVYLIDFIHLPYPEQLYWKSYNIIPPCNNLSEAISRPKFERDFEGKFSENDDLDAYMNRIINELKARSDLWDIPEEATVRTHLISENRKLWCEEIANLCGIFIESIREGILRKKIKDNNWNTPDNYKKGSINALHVILENSKMSIEPLSVFREIIDVRNNGYGHKSHKNQTKISDLEKKAKDSFGSLKIHYSHLVDDLLKSLMFFIIEFDNGRFK